MLYNARARRRSRAARSPVVPSRHRLSTALDAARTAGIGASWIEINMRQRDRSAAFWLSFALAGAGALAGCGGGGSSALPASHKGSGGTASQASPAKGRAAKSTSGPQLPRAADAFVDTIGVNIHLSYYGTPYGDNFPLIFSRLTALGIRHVRDGVVLGQSNICDANRQLAGAGIHVDSITAPSQDTSQLQSWASCAGPALEALEGPNEYDINHPSSDPAWNATLSAYQATLYNAKGALPSVAIIGPALTSQWAFGAVGNLSGVVDYGNMHDYFAGRNPGTSGWSGTDAFGTYGALTWNLAVARQATGEKPIMATETGYTDGVPAAIKQRYIARTLLEHWNTGVTRTYVYELLDEGGDTYGLLDSAGNSKPAYVMLQNLIAHLADPGGAFTPTPLSYAMTADASVHQTLLQKRNGSYCLALWVEEQEWDPIANVVQSSAARSVALRFDTPPSALSATTFDDLGNASSTPLTPSDGSVTLNATGNVTLVDIKS
jgi:hypothetical protein